MLKDLKNNRRGIIFITVLMIIIVMTVLTISVISMNVSQYLIAEGEVKRVQAEILAMGALSYTFANQLSSSPGDSITYTETLGNITYTIESDIITGGTEPYNLEIKVSY